MGFYINVPAFQRVVLVLADPIKDTQIVSKILPIFDDKQWSWVITSDIPTEKGGGEKAN